MINVAIIGSTGYAGEELVRILSMHKDANIKFLCSQKYAGENYNNVYKNYYNIIEDKLEKDDIVNISKDVDVIFMATPQGYASSMLNNEILNNCKIIDLSADYRIKDVNTYEEWYKIKHNSKDYIKESVYGLTEIYRNEIKKAKIVANPGCYTTCSIMTLAPIVKTNFINKKSIIIDAKSGVTGAGRNEKIDNLYCEVNENIKAYGITTHRHTPEIEQELSALSGEDIKISFTPHLIPMNRGILVTAYAELKEDIGYEDLKKIYNEFYKNEKFVRLLNENVYPETRCVKNSNYIDINFKIDKRTKRVLLFGAIDNLIKGAAGQAVQNMNVMFDLKEDEGLDFIPSIL